MRAAWLAAAAATLAAGPSPGEAAPARYRIDPEHFSVAFRAMHIGYASVIGLVGRGEGGFVFDEATRSLSDLRVTVDPASLTTLHEARDGHIHGPDFLDVERFPTITYVMTRAEPTGERTGRVHGDLTVRGITRPVTLEVTWNKSGTYPYNESYAIGISARATVRRSEFGMTYAVENGWVGDVVPIEIELEAIRER
jgi:polyisoprenoid-binding protein YceI